MFLWITSEFHSLHFEHASPPLSYPAQIYFSLHPHPPNLMSSFLFSENSLSGISVAFILLAMCLSSGSILYLPNAVPSKKTNSPSSSSHQLPIAPQLKVGLHSNLPLCALGVFQAWALMAVFICWQSLWVPMHSSRIIPGSLGRRGWHKAEHSAVFYSLPLGFRYSLQLSE